MTKVIIGRKICKGEAISAGCSVTIFSKDRSQILLTKRTDNQLWCLPGGRIEGGENVKETCIREVKEETGFDIMITRLIGVYSDPNMLVQYLDGNKFQIFALNFEAVIFSGNFNANEEVSDINYFSVREISQMPIFEIHRERIYDALKIVSDVIIK